MSRLYRMILVVSTLLASWLGMQAVHELGHVIGAWYTGGSVDRVILHLLSISRTDLDRNPHPLVVAWAGPILGVTLPLAVWAVTAAIDSTTAAKPVLIRPIRSIGVLLPTFLFRFFAGFCLISNGLYIGLGSFEGIGDCGDLLRHGASLWQLWLFGVITAPAGLALWHGQGRCFGLGPRAKPVQPTAAYVAFTAALFHLLLFLMHAALS
jgi:hypothetical protein